MRWLLVSRRLERPNCVLVGWMADLKVGQYIGRGRLQPRGAARHGRRALRGCGLGLGIEEAGMKASATLRRIERRPALDGGGVGFGLG
jgi:hypothetical protein